MTTLYPATLPAAQPAGLDPFELIGRADRRRLPADVVDAYPLAEAQQAVLDRIGSAGDGQGGTGTAGGGPGTAEVAGCRIGDGTPFSAERLRVAVEATVRRYDVLRTSIDLTGCSEPLQRVHATAVPDITVHDHRQLDEPARLAAFAAVVRAGRGYRFDLSCPPLLRLDVVREPGGWVLLVTAHPALSAVVSLHALVARVRCAYRVAPDADPVLDLESELLPHGGCVAAELDGWPDPEWSGYWSAIMAHPPATLPAAWREPEPAGQPQRAGQPEGAGQPEPAGDHEVAVDLAEFDPGLRSLAATVGVAGPTVLLAAHLKVLSMITAEPAARTEVVCLPATGTGGDPGAGCDERLHRVVRPVALPRAATWGQLVARVAAGQRQAWAHRYAPCDRAAPAGDGERLGGAVFEAPDPAGIDRLAGTGPVPPVHGFPGPGLHVLVAGDQLRLRFAGGVVTRAHAQRMASMYRAVLAAMAADPHGDARASYLPPDERHTVLVGWATGATVERGTTTVVELIEAQAAATPQAPAVRTAAGTLTYRELSERSNRIAQHLAGLGAATDALVGVCLARTLDLVPTLLGVWKTGAGYLPLDPELPVERLRTMISAAGCRLVVATAEHEPLLGRLDGTVVLLDRDRARIEAQPATPPPVRIDPAQLAYVIYTSGSTGTPKGVMVPHRGLANYLLWTVTGYASHRTGGAPLFSSISFDLGIPNLFTPLITGAPVHLLPQPLDIADLGAQLAAGGPYSFIKMTPGHLDLLTYQLTGEQVRDLAGIAIGAGDSFTAALAGRWLDLAGPGGTIVATEYGPTEITIGNSGQPVTEVPGTELVPLGAPIPNTTMYVLTDRLEPVPVGVPGEVYIGGVGVARGYLGRPDLTADRFLPDPYGPPGSRLYRSGDLARWLPDGTLDFLGRIDNQVKIRGYRVELGEIQAILCRHPQVRDAVVVPREPNPGDKRLVAYLVLAAGQPLDAAGLRAHLQAALPEYMIPAAFVAIDRIPLTPNGKLDLRALPALL